MGLAELTIKDVCNKRNAYFIKCPNCGLKFKVPKPTKKNKDRIYALICSVPYFQNKGCGLSIRINY